MTVGVVPIQPHSVYSKSPPLAVQLDHIELVTSLLVVVAFGVVDGVVVIAGVVDRPLVVVLGAADVVVNSPLLRCLRLAAESAVTVTVGIG